jgi:hypothetical protein
LRQITVLSFSDSLFKIFILTTEVLAWSFGPLVVENLTKI